MAAKVLRNGVAVLVAGTCFVAYDRRPRRDVAGTGINSAMGDERKCLQEDNVFMTVGRQVVIGLASALSRTIMLDYNDFQAVREEILENAILHRPKGQSLITVENHTSTVDDPAVLASMVSPSIAYDTSRSRWSLCSQEYCFKNGLTSTLAGLAQALPIRRGGGIDQPLLKDFHSRVLRGDWVHIFPEGRIYQPSGLFLRSEEERRHVVGGGGLKWGVGKLVAEAEVPPMVVPIVHMGMEQIIPQNLVTRKMHSPIPRTGNKVRVVVGEALDFSDLLEQHREPRRVARERLRELLEAGPANGGIYSAHERILRDEAEYVLSDPWHSTSEDRVLYAAITNRVEAALLELEQEATAVYAAAADGTEEENKGQQVSQE